jgi:tRNA-2-methylthio-N6-dimethylallyladenosine synthase
MTRIQMAPLIRNHDLPTLQHVGQDYTQGENELPGYYIWTVGCQMNKADSERLGGALEQVGFQEKFSPEDAQVIVLNSCVVRQSAEDRVVGALGRMQSLKQTEKGHILALMGCMVGPQTAELRRRFPKVDLFLRPQEYGPLLELVGKHKNTKLENSSILALPVHTKISTYVPVTHGCDLFCSFCIIPYRRGRQVSRPITELVQEVEQLTARGVREVTLLGQTVDAYGLDLPGEPNLADLLYAVHEIPKLERIRFLTSHPMFLSERIIDAVAVLPKVCEQINLPVQSGDNTVLKRMRRTYTREQYYHLVETIRERIPKVALSTDIIVGFCDETPEQFQKSLDIVEELEFDKIHVAAYSQRNGTIAARNLTDSVPLLEKERRKRMIEELQETTARRINAKLMDQTVEVLVEEPRRGKWQGRTRTDKLIFFSDDEDRRGQTIKVRITGTGPWSLQGEPLESVDL